MGFLIQSLCYLFAFAAGSAVACMTASVIVKRSADKQISVNVSGHGVYEGR